MRQAVVVWLWALWIVAFHGAPGFAGELTAAGREVDVELHDLELWDQDGSTVRFKSDVIGDRVVAIVPFYTNCTTAYPILIYVFSRLQDLLGEHLGRDVVLISVSVDPRTDIPPRLKAFATRKKAKPGWVFVSGERNALGRVLDGIGVQYLVGQSLDEHSHIPLTLVGDPRGQWKRFYGYPSPDVLLTEINRFLASRGSRSEGK
ncbi:MAG: SCO family protein [Syntrophobacteraceae bacterium]|jgi:protein SCO1/2|nr:SCO family protein [Syntrophobacteraceae bacterium]